jgi:hypothetical protein
MFAVVIAALLALMYQNAESQTAAQPHPQPAVRAVLAAFDRYPVVALGMSHRLQDEADLAIAIVRDPRFGRIANAVVVECGNPLYQADMDRYVAGGSVPMERLRLFWRNTTQPGQCDARQHKELVDAVREVNVRLPKDRRIRLLAGDPPIDWNRARSSADVAPFFGDRDTQFASVVEREVLAKHHKALLVVGSAHVLHRSPSLASSPQPSPPTVTTLIERSRPHSVFVIQPHDGFGDRTGDLEPQLASWPVPSLANVDGTWLGQLDAALIFRGSIRFFGPDLSRPPDPFSGLKLQDLVDAYLYLGPAASLRAVEIPPPSDSAYARELERRRQLLGGKRAALKRRLPQS